MTRITCALIQTNGLYLQVLVCILLLVVLCFLCRCCCFCVVSSTISCVLYTKFNCECTCFCAVSCKVIYLKSVIILETIYEFHCIEQEKYSNETKQTRKKMVFDRRRNRQFQLYLLFFIEYAK